MAQFKYDSQEDEKVNSLSLLASGSKNGVKIIMYFRRPKVLVILGEIFKAYTLRLFVHKLICTRLSILFSIF